jgi:hypothetical protein
MQNQMMSQPQNLVMPQNQMMPQTPVNRSPTEQGQLQFQNMSYSTTPNGTVPLQTGPVQQMQQQMYPQNGSIAQPQIGLGQGRILESSVQSDKEIMEKYKVTKVALKALKSLKRNYGKKYSKHLKEVKSKIKYFSGYVMSGDPIKKLQILKNKLDKATSLIRHKKKHRARKLHKKKRPKKKKRKLFFKSIKKLFGGAAKAGDLAVKQLALKDLLEANPNPSLKELLKTCGMGRKKKFMKNLGIDNMNKFALIATSMGIVARVSAEFLKNKFIINPLKSNWKKIIGIGENYDSNLKKLNADILKAKEVLKKKEQQLAEIKSKLKSSIARNDREFHAYARTVKVPKGKAKRAPIKDISVLKFEPSVNVQSMLTTNSIDCGLQLRSFLDIRANHSPLKERYCKHVYRTFKKVKIKDLMFYSKLARNEILSILSMKRSLYCGVCDATLQNNFDDKHKLILYSQRFCHDLVSQYKDYIKFRHIILIEFYDQFFQLISCFEFKNELGVDYPYRTMLESRKRRIPSIKKCLLNLNTPDFYKFCYFVCSQFNLLKFSPFFDGDLDLLKTLYAKFTMFFRRYKVYRKNLSKGKKGKRKRKRKRKLRLKHKKSIAQALIAPVETENGINSVSPVLKKSIDIGENSEKQNRTKLKKKRTKKRKNKLGEEGKEKMRSLKKHLNRINTSLTDEISMLVMNHKTQTNKKHQELMDRKKYIENYHKGNKGLKILSEKKKEKKKSVKEKKPTIQVDTEKQDTQVKGLEKESPKSGLWGRKRILASDITQTFSNDLQNSFFEKRLEEENKREAELTQSVKISSDNNESGRNLKLNLKSMKEHSDNPSEEVNKKVKKPKKKFKFKNHRRKKLTPAQKIRRKISYLRLHTESSRLPKYYNYQINPNLKLTYTETAYSKSIYHKTHLPFAIKTFRPFFASSIHGFNPLRTTEMMRLDFDPRQIIALTRKKNYKPEKLVGKVVKSYLSFDREDMAGFMNDVNLDFDEYRHTNDKNYSTRTVWPKYKMMKRGKHKPQFIRDDSKPFEPQTPQEFSNPDMQDLHGHYRKNVSNNHDAALWHKIFGR